MIDASLPEKASMSLILRHSWVKCKKCKHVLWATELLHRFWWVKWRTCSDMQWHVGPQCVSTVSTQSTGRMLSFLLSIEPCLLRLHDLLASASRRSSGAPVVLHATVDAVLACQKLCKAVAAPWGSCCASEGFEKSREFMFQMCTAGVLPIHEKS